MRNLLKFLSAFAALALLSGTAFAQDPTVPPPAPSGPAASTPAAPAPAPAQGTDSTPAPAARREEETQVSFLARIKAYATGKEQMANKITASEQELVSLRAAVSERDATIADLQSTVAAQRADLERIGAYLASIGSAETAAQNPAAAFDAALGAGVAAAVQQIGIPAASVPQSAGGNVSKEDQLISIRERMAATKDSKELGRLAAEASKLRNLN